MVVKYVTIKTHVLNAGKNFQKFIIMTEGLLVIYVGLKLIIKAQLYVMNMETLIGVKTDLDKILPAIFLIHQQNVLNVKIGRYVKSVITTT